MKRKVLFITGSLPPMKCGVGHYTAKLLEHMDTAQLEVGVLTTADASTIKGGRTILKAPGWKLKDIFVLANTVRLFNPDVVHFQYPAVGYGRNLGINLLPLLLRLRKGPKLYITLHEYFGSTLLGRIRNLITVFPANKLIVSNEADKKSLGRYFKKKILLIPIGSNIESLAPITAYAKEVIGTGSRFNSDYLLFFGFPFAAKRIEELIRAMEYITDKRLLIVASLSSSDKYQNFLLETIKKSPANGRIKVVDFLPDDKLVALLKRAFCFVLPQDVALNSKSGTVVAATINGLPVVGKKGLTLENKPFISGDNCLLLPALSAQSIAEGINGLAGDKELYERIEHGSILLADFFSWKEIVSRHVNLYKESNT